RLPLWQVLVNLELTSGEGVAVPWTLSHFVRDPAELPSVGDLKKEMRRAIQQMRQIASAPTLRAYSGPVLLGPRPAGLLMHEALGHRLEGSRLLSSGEGQTFKDSLGESLGEIREAYDAAPLCPLVEARLAVVECAARPIQPRVDLSGWDALVTVGCEAPDARGDGGGTHWIPRSFEVLAPGSYEVAVAADPADGAEVILGRCGGRCGGGVYQRLVAGDVLTVELDAGWHYILFVRRDGLPGDVALTITGVEDRRGKGAGARR
ncbi:MAG: hypothetical protein KC420_18560, partial [Myxococcales bacterium]|nr:hypothetical protein [Myxococcales bacterium]